VGRRFQDDNQFDLFALTSGAVELEAPQEDCSDPVEDLKKIIRRCYDRWKTGLSKNSLNDLSSKSELKNNSPQEFWPLVVICLKDVYKKEIKKCQNQFKKIRELKSEIHKFVKVDLPAYSVWEKSEFSVELNLLAHLRDKLLEKMASGSSFEFKEEAQGPCYWQEDDFSRDQESYEFRKTLIEHLLELLSESDWNNLAKKDSRKEFLGILFAELNNHIVFKGVDDTDLVERAASFFEQGVKEHGDKIDPLELKSLYKIVATKLHPDKCQDLAGELTLELWQKLEEGFKNQDLAEIRKAYTLFMVLFEPHQKGFSLFELKQIEKDQKTQLKALKDELQKLKRNKEFGFSHFNQTALSELKKQLKMAFDDQIALLKNQLNSK
jgi:hypothetical protein